MSEFAIVGLIVFICAVLPCLVCGYLIAFRGRRHLISGWNESKYSNPEGAAKTIGISLILMAFLLAVTTLSWGIQVITETVLIYFLVPVSIVPILALIYAKVRFGAK